MEHLPKKIHQKRHQLHAGGRILHPRSGAAGGKPPHWTVGAGCTRCFCKNTGPASTAPLLLSGKLWTYLADLNEQADDRLACIVSQMQEAEGVTEELKARDQLAWVGAMNSIRSRAEEIILSEIIFV